MAKKKKYEKMQGEILNHIESLQISNLMSLKSAVTNLQKEIDNLHTKIESDGISCYYSAHSDVSRHSQSVWSSCWRLSTLKRYENEVRSDNFLKDKKK